MSDHVSQTAQVYNQIADKYAKTIEEYGPTIERDKFIKLVTPEGNILDAGCGPGRDSAFFVENGFITTGIDVSEKLLDIAKKRVPQADFKLQDLRNITLPADSFDGIWACASLLHLNRSEIPDVIKKFKALLKPRGVLCVIVKEGTGEADISEKVSENLTRHFTYFKIDELKQYLTQENFTILDACVYNEKDRNPTLRDLKWVACFAKKL